MLDWLANTYNAFIDFLWQLILSIFDMLKDLFIFVIESLMDIGLLFLDGVGALMDGLNIAQYWAFLPAETAHTMSLIGLSEAMGMIVTCLTVRFLLQTIPFVRWGS